MMRNSRCQGQKNLKYISDEALIRRSANASILAEVEPNQKARIIIWRKKAVNYEPEREDIAYNAACASSLLRDTKLALQRLQTTLGGWFSTIAGDRLNVWIGFRQLNSRSPS